MPTTGELLLGWGTALPAAAVWVAGLVSLSRSPLDARRRIPWLLAQVILPVLGALIWFWWRHRHYPARLRSQPDWDPNDRTPPVLPPPRRRGTAPSRIGAPDPWAGHAPPEGLAPRRRYAPGASAEADRGHGRGRPVRD